MKERWAVCALRWPVMGDEIPALHVPDRKTGVAMLRALGGEVPPGRERFLLGYRWKKTGGRGRDKRFAWHITRSYIVTKHCPEGYWMPNDSDPRHLVMARELRDYLKLEVQAC